MSRQAHIDRVWHVIDKAGICMMTTQFDGGMRATDGGPPRQRCGRHLVLDRTTRSTPTPAVCLTFLYEKEKVYLSLTGEAFVANDPGRARALWNEKQKLWWSGPDDPNLRVVRVEPEKAEMWDGPASSAVAAFEFAKARLTGSKPDLGENRKVSVELD